MGCVLEFLTAQEETKNIPKVKMAKKLEELSES